MYMQFGVCNQCRIRNCSSGLIELVKSTGMWDVDNV